MAKMAKKKQTDYTIGGHDISETAIPLYQANLNRMGEYLENPQARQEKYLRDYYDSNTRTSDFLTNYKRAMAEQTGQNYSATTGGYTSTGQRNYDDLQNYYDKFAAYLRDQGVQSAYNMANQDYQNMLAGNNSYYNAYGLGKEYSDIDQYNYIADQNNDFWNQALGISGNQAMGAGKILSSIPTPWTQAIGAGLQAAGQFQKDLTVDTSAALNSIGAGTAQRAQGTGIDTDGISKGLNATNALGGKNWVTKLYGTKVK